jgi:SPX domain protein involved in polyphosphate accumulation
MSFLIDSYNDADFRNEVKFTHLNVNRDEFVRKLNKSKFMFEEIHKKRWVNNIYFDSLWLDLYATSIEGVSDRTKVRMRWYGEKFGTISPVIEFKMKRGHKNVKATYPVGEIKIINGEHKRHIVGRIMDSKILPYEIKNALKKLSPTLVNRYYRSYHLSNDKLHRLTIDTSISFFSFLKSQNIRKEYNDANHLLITELKFDTSNRFTSSIMSDIGNYYRVSQISKYTYGLRYS